MGLHSGEAAIAGHGYVGLDVHRGARIMSAGHGGQVLLSDATRHLLGNEIDGLALRDLGEHRLKDLTALRLYQLLIPGLPAEFPALKTLDNQTTNLPLQPTLSMIESALRTSRSGWRQCGPAKTTFT
jgi:hypothetical protein